jgi:hypothetical protein
MTILSVEEVEATKAIQMDRFGHLEVVQLALSHERLRARVDVLKAEADASYDEAVHAHMIVDEKDREIERLLARIVELEDRLVTTSSELVLIQHAGTFKKLAESGD